MTVSELLAIVSKAVEDGHGQAEVVFDTDAACYSVHLVDVGTAALESAENMPGGRDLLILSTPGYHGKGEGCSTKGRD